MTQRIEIDGKIHEFPDDFTQNEISDALTQSSPMPARRPDTQLGAAPMQPVTGRTNLQAAGEGVGKFTRAALQGASAIPYLFADAGTQAINLADQGINKVAGTDIPQLRYPSQLRDESLAKVLPQDKNLIDKVGSGMTQFVSTIPTGVGLSKMAPELATLGENVPGQIKAALPAGAAYGTAQHYFPNDPLIQMAAGTLGGAAGAKATAMAETPAVPKPIIPTKPQLETAGGQAYEAARGTNLVIKPEAVGRLKTDIAMKLEDKAFHEGLQPKVVPVIDEVNKLSQGEVTIKQMMNLKRLVGNAYDPTNKTSNKMLLSIGRQIDDFMGGIGAADVAEGDAALAASKWKEGDKLWTQYSKAQTIDDAFERAKNNAAVSGSGGNIQNSVKQQFRTILNSPSKRRGFSKDEISSMQSIVDGTPTQNALRWVGKMSPIGSALMGSLWTTAGYMHPPLLLAPAAGVVSKFAADTMTKNSVNRLSELVRSGGSVAEPAKAPMGDQISPAIVQLLQRLAVSNQQGGSQSAHSPLFGLPSAATEPQDIRRRRIP